MGEMFYKRILTFTGICSIAVALYILNKVIWQSNSLVEMTLLLEDNILLISFYFLISFISWKILKNR